MKPSAHFSLGRSLRTLGAAVACALLATTAQASSEDEASQPGLDSAAAHAATPALPDDEAPPAETAQHAGAKPAADVSSESSVRRARQIRNQRARARLAATHVLANDPVPESAPVPGLREVQPVTDEWARGARFFGGLRSGIGFAPGGLGPAGTLGLELGVTAFRGLGFGLHVFGIGNPPEVPLLDIPRAEYGMGAAVDVRWYLQTIRPLKLYPTMSVGFMAGPSIDTGANVVLPTVTPGFGARVNIGEVYVSLEMGAATFYIPFVNLAVGWEPTRAVD
jgi:hypothetical protein